MYVRTYLLVLFLSLGISPTHAQSQIQKSIRDHLQSEADRGFSGSVLVAQKGQIVFEGAYGYADKATNTKNQTSTQFSLASLGKFFTMVAIMQLVDEGKLNLDDKLTTYVKGFQDKRANQITIEHLLRHRAGWRHYWNNPEYLRKRLETDSILDYLRVIKGMPLGFEPGSQSQYSNIGYVLLGAVIEEITKEDYYQHIHKKIFEPLGMIHSDYASYRQLNSNYARHGGDGAKVNLLDMTAVKGTADGGGYSTVHDLYRLSQAIFEGELLSESSKALIVNGFNSPDLRPDWSARFAGGFPGISTVLAHYSEDNLTIVVLSNSERYSAPNLQDRLTSLIRK